MYVHRDKPPAPAPWDSDPDLVAPGVALAGVGEDYRAAVRRIVAPPSQVAAPIDPCVLFVALPALGLAALELLAR
jgi:hypothetical protein